jgi:subtilisin family serine protease
MPNYQPSSLPRIQLCAFLAARTRRRCSLLLAAVTLFVLFVPAPSATLRIAAQTPPQYVLVKLAPQAWETPQRALSGHKLSGWEQLHVPGWIRVTLDHDHDATLAALHDDPHVQAIEEDHRVQIALTPDDTHWSNQWGPQIVHAPDAWDIHTSGQAVVVAVLDTGIDLDHSDLTGQLWVNQEEIPGNALDDDANGYVDDIHGWNVLDAGSSVIDDDHGHGTHVSGIIAARGNNGQGIAGMAWDSQVMVVKVLDENGDGYYSGLATGLTYAADNGARVANLSLGGSNPSQILQDAVEYAHAHGTLVVASSGNTNSDVQYPAAYETALAIAASTRYDERASYSCFGPEVDLAAPGSSILSTCEGGGYCYKSGTSMAAPHVAGLAALIYAERPTFAPDQVAQLLIETAQDIDSTGWDANTGWGRIDAYRALARLEARFHYYLPIVQVGTRRIESLR